MRVIVTLAPTNKIRRPHLSSSLRCTLVIGLCLSQTCRGFLSSSRTQYVKSPILSQDKKNNHCTAPRVNPSSSKVFSLKERCDNGNNNRSIKVKSERTLRTKIKPTLRALTIPSIALLTPAVALAATTTTTITSNPLLKITLACALPSLLGFYKSEYGVSYAYGTAVASSSLVALSHYASGCAIATTPALLPFQKLHAVVTLFYGTRLTLFLLYRELTIPRFSEFRERIEQKAKKRGGRLNRTPFIVTCALLYACLAAPLFTTTFVGAAAASSPSCASAVATTLYKLFVPLSLVGFLLNATGDLTKTLAKRKDPDALVTSGVFSVFRHPNYTGEQIGWTFHFLAGVASFVACGGGGSVSGGGVTTMMRGVVTNPVLWAGLLGWVGIEFVLFGATTALETQQKGRYGEREDYIEWVKRSWGGFRF